MEEILQEEGIKNNIILCLGPHSTQLNPIESLWSQLKAIVKCDLEENKSGLLKRVDVQSLITLRKDRLVSSMRSSLLQLITSQITSYIENIAYHYENVICMNDLFF